MNTAAPDPSAAFPGELALGFALKEIADTTDASSEWPDVLVAIIKRAREIDSISSAVGSSGSDDVLWCAWDAYNARKDELDALEEGSLAYRTHEAMRAAIQSVAPATAVGGDPSPADWLRGMLAALPTTVLTDERIRAVEYEARRGMTATPAAPVGGFVVDEMVNRFLCWPLPKDFAPDAGISFNPGPTQLMPLGWPVGTNLFTADQARAMFLHCASPAAQPSAKDGECESRESKMVVVECDEAGNPTVWCDPEIVDLVAALNSGGIPTVASCSGHGVNVGNIALRDGRELFIAPNFVSARKWEATPASGLVDEEMVERARRAYSRTLRGPQHFTNGDDMDANRHAAWVAALEAAIGREVTK